MIKDIERRRAKGREAQARYRRRHPERVRAASNSEKSCASRRAWRLRNIEKVRAYARDAQRRKRQAARTAGISPALDRMRADLKACYDPQVRQRLIEAIAHMERVVMGGKGIKPRDPRRARLRPMPQVPFNAP